MIRSPLSLQSLCSQSVIETQDLCNLLIPHEYDSTEDISFDGRLTDNEWCDFHQLAATSQLTMTECKDTLRSMLYRRPCNLDLIMLRKSPLCKDMTDLSLRQLWADTIILYWEWNLINHLQTQLELKRVVMTWDIHNRLLDGCASEDLFNFLKVEREHLVKKDEDEARLAQEKKDIKDWKKTVGNEWLQDMRFIINYASILFI